MDAVDHQQNTPFPDPRKDLAPFLSLSGEIPMELSKENKEILATIQKNQPERNQEIWQEHTFPLGAFLFALFLLILPPLFLNLKSVLSSPKR